MLTLSKEFFQQKSDVVNDEFDIEPEYISACRKQETIWECYVGAPETSDYPVVAKFDQKDYGNSFALKDSTVGWRMPKKEL